MGLDPRRLEESRWFVAVVSPAAAGSPWVARELAWWVEHRGTDQLLVVQADGACRGTPNATTGPPTPMRYPLPSAARSAPNRIGWTRRGPQGKPSSNVVTAASWTCWPRSPRRCRTRRRKRLSVESCGSAAAPCAPQWARVHVVVGVGDRGGDRPRVDRAGSTRQGRDPTSTGAVAEPCRAGHRAQQQSTRSRHPARGGSVAPRGHQPGGAGPDRRRAIGLAGRGALPRARQRRVVLDLVSEGEHGYALAGRLDGSLLTWRLPSATKGETVPKSPESPHKASIAGIARDATGKRDRDRRRERTRRGVGRGDARVADDVQRPRGHHRRRQAGLPRRRPHRRRQDPDGLDRGGHPALGRRSPGATRVVAARREQRDRHARRDVR